jgi:aryl-alcohol dehydrogenase-like predicted oxidoreductase
MFLYVIGTNERYQKIGFSANVERRLKSLQTGNPDKLTIHHVEPVPKEQVRLLERKIHKDLAHYRLKGEWFNLTSQEAVDLLKFNLIRWLDDNTLKYQL